MPPKMVEIDGEAPCAVEETRSEEGAGLRGVGSQTQFVKSDITDLTTAIEL